MNHNGPGQYPSEAVSPVVTQEDIDALMASMPDPSDLIDTMQRERVAAEFLMLNVLSGLDTGVKLDIDQADHTLDTAGYVYDLLDKRSTDQSN